MSSSRIIRRSLAAAATLTVLVAAPAAAHPFISGGELPVDSLVTMRLNMAHGCGGDDGGTEDATTEVALEVPDWLRIVEVAETDGYASETETDDGTVTAVTWTVDGEGVPAPAFDLEVVASGTPGETRHLAVFQGCADDSYRWVGTPDQPADDPAVNVALIAADPDAPPPGFSPPPEPESDADPTPVDEPVEDPTDAGTEDATDEPPSDGPDTDTAAAEDDGVSLVLLGGLVVVALAVIALLASRRRGGGA